MIFTMISLKVMYNALIAAMDLAMENERGLLSGHLLLYSPDNEPRHYEARSSNPGAVAALNYVCANVQPRHTLRLNDYTSCHRFTAEHWIVKCSDTGPYSLYHRLSRYAMAEEAIGNKYSVTFRLASCDIELHLGNALLFHHFNSL